MKSFKKFLVLAVCVMVVVMGFSSCGDDTSSFDKAMTEHLCGLQWKESGTNRMVRMYRNHMVETWSSGNINSGALTYGDNTFYGVWSLVGDKLTTKFTTGNNTGFDQNMLMHGTMTVKAGSWNAWYGKDDDGVEHSYYYDNKRFTDYTDESEHDGALHGRWNTTAYVNKKPMLCVMTIRKDGSMNYEIKDLDLDVNTSYTTKNGHVEIQDFIFPDNKASFLYIRNEAINFLSEENGVRAWRWEKME